MGYGFQTEALTVLRNELFHYLNSGGRDNVVIIQTIIDCLLEKYRNQLENPEWSQKVREAYSVAFRLFQQAIPGQWVQKQVRSRYYYQLPTHNLPYACIVTSQ